MATPCDFCGGTMKKHLGDCPFGPTDAGTADPGKRGKGHQHDYKPNGSQQGPVQKEWQGLRRVRFRVTYYFERCNAEGCPQPDRVVPRTEYL